MTYLYIEQEDEEIARYRMFRLIKYMLTYGEKLSASVRRYEASNGDVYKVIYSLNLSCDWHAKFLCNEQLLCVFQLPGGIASKRTVAEAKAHPITDEQLFISEFYEFIDDYEER